MTKVTMRTRRKPIVLVFVLLRAFGSSWFRQTAEPSLQSVSEIQPTFFFVLRAVRAFVMKRRDMPASGGWPAA
jgi:hypothetical protein